MICILFLVFCIIGCIFFFIVDICIYKGLKLLIFLNKFMSVMLVLGWVLVINEVRFFIFDV